MFWPCSLAPGKGFLNLLLSAGWLAPCGRTAKRPFYRSEDVRKAPERIDPGEMPEAVFVWRTALGQDSAHLVGPKNQAVCGSREKEWMATVRARQCTRCMHAGKTLRVEN